MQLKLTKKIVISSIISFLFIGCSQKNLEIRDIREISQQPDNYIKNIESFNKDLQREFDNDFNIKYFQPWDLDKITYSKKEAIWGFSYSKRNVYGENLRLISKEWFDKEIKNSNFIKYNTLNKKAITINNTNLRVFPTNKPIFYNPKKAGEGFPFDYNQNSALKINSPIFISHFSKDKAWVFVQSSFALGWVSVNDIAFVDDNFIKNFKIDSYAINIKDNLAIYQNKNFRTYIKLGTLFPKKDDKFLIANVNQKNREAYISFIDFNKNIVNKPLEFNNKNISKILNELIGELYGWGGLLNNRDCSATTRDIFAPFGIYIQRNSSAQAKDGFYIPLDKYSIDKKIDLILEKGIPFQTLLYLKGHIMLYIGKYNNKPLVFHNTWGIKTIDFFGNYGRKIIGKTVITTLEAGKEIDGFYEKSSLINRIKGMVKVTKNKN